MNKKILWAALILGPLILSSAFSHAQNQKLADSLLAVDRSVLDDSSQLFLLKEITRSLSNPDSILAYTDTLLTLAVKKNDKLNVSVAYFKKGTAYRLKGDLQKASEFFFKSADICTKMNYKKGIAVAYLALGDIYSLNDDHPNSVEYYLKAIVICEEIGDSTNLASAFLNLGDEYFNRGNMNAALNYFEKSQIIFGELDFKIGMGYCLGNIGLVHAYQNKNELSEANLQKAIVILESLGDYYPIAVYLTYMADIYIEKNDVKRAFEYAHRSLDMSIKMGHKEQIRDAYLKLAELYGGQEKFDKAYEYQNQYIVYRDSVNNEATTKAIADLRTSFEVAQKQSEIDLLLEKDKNNQIIAGCLILVVILIGFLAYELHRNNRRKLSINQKLTLQKDALKTHRDNLQNLNQTKDRFFSIISHDLRGPVNAFNGISNLIKHYVNQNDMKNLVEVTEYIDKSASQLSTLLDNLLDWAISQQGGFPYNPDKISLNQIIEENVEIFQTTAHAKGIALRVNIGDTIYLWADKNSLTTILRNLMNNALKFTNKGGSVTISATESEQWAKIEVIDNGIGIPTKKLQSIFDLMEKKNTQGTAGEKGLGLGLQLAYDFTEMNKGSISVASEENVGTTFTLKIPLFNAKFIQGQQKKLQSASG